MSFLQVVEEAQLHRETYIGVLDGLLRRQGSKRDLTERVGIAPRYLSYLLDPYGNRIPSRELAECIASSLPMPAEQSQKLLEHMILASEKRVRAQEFAQQGLPSHAVGDWAKAVREAYEQASFSRDPLQSRVKYRLVQEAGSLAIKSLIASRDPLAVVELCLMAHEAACVLNRPVDALWHAKRARFIMEGLDELELDPLRERVVDQVINSIRAEAVASTNLGLFKQAYACCERAKALLATRRFRHRGEFWIPHLHRDMMKALAGKPRFAISEAVGLANQVESACDKDIYSTSENELLVFLIHSSLARSYTQYGGKRNQKTAESVLRAELDRLGKMARVGSLHRAQLLRSYARLRWEQGDREGWRHFITSVLEIALSAGLEHQIHRLREEYGRAVEPMLQDHGVAPLGGSSAETGVESGF